MSTFVAGQKTEQSAALRMFIQFRYIFLFIATHSVDKLDHELIIVSISNYKSQKLIHHDD